MIPPLDSNHILRNVTLAWHPEYRLLTWEPIGAPRFSTGQYRIGYAFYVPDAGSVRGGRAVEPLFSGEDCGVSPMHAIDSDATLVKLLCFLTLRPCDTNDEYFKYYTPEQMAFAEGEAEELSQYGFDGENDGNAPYADRFVDVESEDQ